MPVAVSSEKTSRQFLEWIETLATLLLETDNVHFLLLIKKESPCTSFMQEQVFSPFRTVEIYRHG